MLDSKRFIFKHILCGTRRAFCLISAILIYSNQSIAFIVSVKPVPRRNMKNNSASNKFTTKNNEEIEQKVMEPYNYLNEVAGKCTREKLAKAFNYWLNVPIDKLRLVDEIVLIFHNSSLLIDDIQDGSELRRGRPAAHLVFGAPSTINSTGYVMLSALQQCLALGHPDAFDVCCRYGMEVHMGQGMDIYWRDNMICPSEDEYEDMATKKTGACFVMVFKLMQLFSDNKKDFTKIVQLLGLSYQIQNDYINLKQKNYMDRNGFCNDLTEGKFSFPLIHAISQPDGESQVLNILKQKTQNVELKKYCVSLLESCGSFEYTRQRLERLSQEIRAEMTQLGCNSQLDEWLDFVLNECNA